MKNEIDFGFWTYGLVWIGMLMLMLLGGLGYLPGW